VSINIPETVIVSSYIQPLVIKKEIESKSITKSFLQINTTKRSFKDLEITSNLIESFNYSTNQSITNPKINKMIDMKEELSIQCIENIEIKGKDDKKNDLINTNVKDTNNSTLLQSELKNSDSSDNNFIINNNLIILIILRFK